MRKLNQEIPLSEANPEEHFPGTVFSSGLAPSLRKIPGTDLPVNVEMDGGRKYSECKGLK